MKTKKIIQLFIIIILVSLTSCEENLRVFDTVVYVPCSQSDVEIDSTVLSDFECQNNVLISNVTQIRNPNEIGINTSRFVGEFIDGAAADDGFVINISSAVSLTTNAFFNIKIKSAITGTMLLTLQGGTSPAAEFTTTVNGNNSWENYLIDVSKEANNNHTEIKVTLNAGVQTNGDDVYLIDDIELNPTIDPCLDVTPNLSIISDFECQENYSLNSDPNNPKVIKVENPNANGVNLSDSVGEYTDDGTDAFDNLSVDFNSVIDLSTQSELNIKILSSRAVPISAKLEGGTSFETTGNIDVTGIWTNYKFDFSSAVNNGNTRLVLTFNVGQTDGTVSDIYYLDDIRFTENTNTCGAIVEDCTNVTPDLSIISDFDCQQNYFLGANPANTDAPTVQNPNISCENRSSNVGSYIDNGTDPFDALFIDLGNPVDLSVKNQLKIKVLTPNAIPIFAKLEGGTPVEIQLTATVVNEWAEYTFDFSSAVGNGNDKLVFFFNAGNTNGTAQDQYFIDDIRFE